MTKVEANTCEIVLNRALDETWRSERRGKEYVVVQGTSLFAKKALKTPQEVGDHIEDHWEEEARRRADPNAFDLGVGRY